MQSKCVPLRRAQAYGSIVHHRYGHLRNLWQPGFFSIEIDRWYTILLLALRSASLFRRIYCLCSLLGEWFEQQRRYLYILEGQNTVSIHRSKHSAVHQFTLRGQFTLMICLTVNWCIVNALTLMMNSTQDVKGQSLLVRTACHKTILLHDRSEIAYWKGWRFYQLKPIQAPTEKCNCHACECIHWLTVEAYKSLLSFFLLSF